MSDELIDPWIVIAKEAYRAYGETTDFKNYQGLPMPEFEDLSDTIRAAWRFAAKQVVDSYLANSAESMSLDEREKGQIEHALHYSENFPYAGVTGHSQFVLIAKLARRLRLFF